ncbi:Uncharacterised protein [Mycobacteroides abscessus subsp. bolletii]|nr:Uncharacterised protein [Mycobacteroides abscessus subsp. bolletii]SHW77065.1 Uncharacterised protein [Mycobacteroides abscessus subsp. bolletii]SHX37128.1 Uncharacterised protein [Mycobacteroides abscessus subsp. bolletii]SHX57955.1 Uncharacterised protein [Mycobacteroides abscessus subsp. bolletii]SKR96834.1 Uncharacterised protein [Mycobacteroides abscessus subsp. bolletii]
MSGNERSTEQLIAVTDCRDLVRSAAAAQRLPSPDLDTSLVSGDEHGRRVAAFAGGCVLVVGAVAALHNLYRGGDDAAELISWSGLLLLALTALGGGIKLAMWGARPVITALFDGAKERLAEAVLAVVASGAVIVGASGMWWTFRGGYASWWHHLTGESRWSLSLGVGQMLVAVAAGAALFTGGRYVTGLAKDALTDSGLLIERDRSAGKRRAPEGLWHPGLVAALVGGGLALVVMTAWLTPKLAPTIAGANVLAAVAAIVAVLVWGVGANLGWWKGLAGLWKWATDASHKTAAISGVVALLMFSAGGLGLGWFTPATVPQAHAQCPPDCGGGSNGGSYGPDASQFQPPQMPNQMPDYQGGINQPPLDQNSSISIYNTQAPSVSNNGRQGSSGQQGPQQSWDQPAHGTQIPDYQTATPYTQGPGRPNPDFNPGSQGGQPNQGAQQPVQQPQQASQQPPQQDAGQQPQQSSDQQKIDDLTRQLQDQQQQSSQDRQRIDDLTKQLQQQNKQNQKQQQSPRFPSKDDKKDRDQQDRDNQSGDNDLSALLLGAASTRRRKQDDQEQGPDAQALGQDASQAVQGLPGDVQTYVQSGQQIGQSSGQAAQGFGSAAQAGASLASSAQSGAVNPQDAITVVQGVSQGIQGTADAVNAGSQIVKTAQGEADQVAQAVGDANPQLKPQMDQARQLNQQAGQITDLVGQGSQLTSQGAGTVNTVSSLGAGGMPDTSGATDALSGTATAVNGPGDVSELPTPSTPVIGGSGTGLRSLAGKPVDFKQEPPPPVPPIPPGTDLDVVPGLANALQGQSKPAQPNPTEVLFDSISPPGAPATAQQVQVPGVDGDVWYDAPSDTAFVFGPNRNLLQTVSPKTVTTYFNGAASPFRFENAVDGSGSRLFLGEAGTMTNPSRLADGRFEGTLDGKHVIAALTGNPGSTDGTALAIVEDPVSSSKLTYGGTSIDKKSTLTRVFNSQGHWLADDTETSTTYAGSEKPKITHDVITDPAEKSGLAGVFHQIGILPNIPYDIHVLTTPGYAGRTQLGAVLDIGMTVLPFRAGALAKGLASLFRGSSGIAKLFSGAELSIFNDAAQIYNSSAFNQIRQAFKDGVAKEVNIGGYKVLYEPSLPTEGFSLASEGHAFVMGPKAFLNEAEIASTIAHEAYRVNMTKIMQEGLDASRAASETDAAFSFSKIAGPIIAGGGS